MPDDWIGVFTTVDHIEAELIKGLLEGSGIPVVVEARGFKALPYIFGTSAMGELILKVPPDRADLAAEILSAKFDEPE